MIYVVQILLGLICDGWSLKVYFDNGILVVEHIAT